MINKSYRWKLVTDDGNLKEPVITLDDNEHTEISINNTENFRNETTALKVLEYHYKKHPNAIIMDDDNLALVSYYKYSRDYDINTEEDIRKLNALMMKGKNNH